MAATATTAFDVLWLGAGCAWSLLCYKAEKFLTRLHATVFLCLSLRLVEMLAATHCAESTPWVRVWVVSSFHALFLVSVFSLIMLVANGYCLTLETLRPRDWVRISLIAMVLGLVRWVRCVADSFQLMLVELTLQYLVLLLVLRASTLNVHFTLFLVALLRRGGIDADHDAVELHCDLFKRCQVAFSCFFMGYMAICAWSWTLLERFYSTFYMLEQSLLFGVFVYVAILIRPRQGVLAQELQLHYPEFARTYTRLLDPMADASSATPDEIIPMVDASSRRQVVVVENPPSRTEAGRMVANLSVGVKHDHPRGPHPCRDIQ